MSIQEYIDRRKSIILKRLCDWENAGNYSHSYVERRLALDNRKFAKYTSNTNKPNYPTTPNVEITQNKLQKKTWRSISAKKLKQARITYKREFPNSVINIDSYRSLNQGQEGACSFVAFITLSKFNNKKLEKGSVTSNWKTNWHQIEEKTNLDEGTSDIAETLDLIPTKYNTQHLIYLPIRSRGVRERQIHPVLTYDPENLKDFHVIDSIINLGALIEGLIDAGIVVEINYGEHSRIAVAYNSSSILFADSWGDLHFEKADDNDIYCGGFSKVNKWLIYSFARDICFFSESLCSQPKKRKVHTNKGESKKEEVKKVDKLPKILADFKRLKLKAGDKYKSVRGSKVYVVPDGISLMPKYKQFKSLCI